MTTDAAVPERSAFAILWDVLVAPAAAFASLRDAPRSTWALVLTCVLGMAGGYLEVPAGQNVLSHTMAHNQQFAALSAAQAQNAKQTTDAFLRFAWLFFPIEVVFEALILAIAFLLANAIGRGSANFTKLFALAANVGVLNLGVAFFLHGVIASLRGAESFQATEDLLATLPNLGWLVPGSSPQLQAFLTSFNVFAIWSIGLFAWGLRAIADLPPALAWGAPILMAVAGASFATLVVH